MTCACYKGFNEFVWGAKISRFSHVFNMNAFFYIELNGGGSLESLGNVTELWGVLSLLNSAGATFSTELPSVQKLTEK